jgi:hypothetical protein
MILRFGFEIPAPTYETGSEPYLSRMLPISSGRRSQYRG